MKLNMELVRDMLFALEEREELGFVGATKLQLSGEYTDDQIKYHAQILQEAGYIAGEPWMIEGVHLHDFHVERLTFKGHEFVGSARNPSAWGIAIKRAKNVGGSLGINAFSEVLGAAARSVIGL